MDPTQFAQPVLDITTIAQEFGFPEQTIISAPLYALLQESTKGSMEQMGHAVATLCGMITRTPPSEDGNRYIAVRFNNQLECIQAEKTTAGYNLNLIRGVAWAEVEAEEDGAALPPHEYSAREADALTPEEQATLVPVDWDTGQCLCEQPRYWDSDTGGVPTLAESFEPTPDWLPPAHPSGLWVPSSWEDKSRGPLDA